MRTDILMVTYRKDFEFAAYALRSVRKYACGFGKLTIVVPMQDVGLFHELVESLLMSPFRASPIPVQVLGVVEPEGKGMLQHMVDIVRADIWCPSADAILHLDSDSLFTEPVTPEDYFVDGKPVLYREKFATVVNKLRVNWQAAVLAAIGVLPEYDYMVRHPIIHLAPTYGLTRALMDNHTGDWKKHILAGRNSFPQEFCEFDTLGHVAFAHAENRYHFVDFDVTTPDGGYAYEKGRDKLKAFWSHGGVAPVRAELEAIVA